MVRNAKRNVLPRQQRAPRPDPSQRLLALLDHHVVIVGVVGHLQPQVLIGAEGADPRSFFDGKEVPNQTMIYPSEGVFIVSSPTAVLKGARSANAAKLFAQFMVTPEAQKIIADSGIHSSRIDMPPPAGQPALTDVKFLPIDLDFIERRSVALYLDGADAPDLADDGSPMIDDDFLLLVNAWWEPLDFTVPPSRPGQSWHREIDTFDPSASDVWRRHGAGDVVAVGPRSVLLLRASAASRRGRSRSGLSGGRLREGVHRNRAAGTGGG